MSFLYLDTTDHLILGLLSPEMRWLEYVDIQEKKSASLIHSEIHRLLTNHSLSWDKLEAVIQTQGPGSYTGIRLAEGMTQLLSWQGLTVRSFYHFEVPQILSHKTGTFISLAYKDELFCYSWNGQESTRSLVSLKKESDILKISKDHLYTHFKAVIQYLPPLAHTSVVETSELIRLSPQDLFNKVLSLQLVRTPYYYRSLDEEFKKGH